MLDRKMKKKDLQAAAGISSTAITKLAQDENVYTETIDKVCMALHCDVGDIMEIVDK